MDSDIFKIWRIFEEEKPQAKKSCPFETAFFLLRDAEINNPS